MTQYAPVVELSELDASEGFRINGEAEGSHSGWSVAAAGDINGDGYADLIIGAPDDSPNGEGSGTAYVVFGAAHGFGTKLDLYALNGANGFRMFGADEVDRTGRSVSSAGDVNGDGFDDLVVGAPNHGPDGAAYVVFGKASGFDPGLQLASLDGSDGFRIDGAGLTVAGGGDINGDGVADLILGSEVNNGSTFVVFGKATPFDPIVSTALLDGNDGFRIKGPAHVVSQFGDVSTGDVNGDGLTDVMISAFTETARNGWPVIHSRTYVLFGDDAGFAPTVKLSGLDGHNGFRFDAEPAVGRSDAFNVASAGDLNGDGFDDLVLGGSVSGQDRHENFRTVPLGYVVFGKADGFDAHLTAASLDGSNGFKIVPVGNFFQSVGSAGDFNGDGYDDLLVNEGDTVSVVFGKPGGFDGTVDLSSLDGNNGFQLHPIDGTSSAAAASDVNGDGFDDLMIGEDGVGDDSGVSTIVFGHRPGEATSVVGSALDNTIHGSDLGDTLSGGDGNDMLVAYAGADVLDGGTGDDTIDAGDGTDTVFGGDGNDTIIGGYFGADRLDGGSGADVFVYKNQQDSFAGQYDTVVGFDFAEDKFDTFLTPSKIDASITSGSISAATFSADVADVLHQVKANHAVMFTADDGDLAGATFLFVNDGQEGYQTQHDFLVRLDSPVNAASMDLSDFM